MCLFQSKGPSLHARQAAAGNAGQPPKTTAVTAEYVEKVSLADARNRKAWPATD